MGNEALLAVKGEEKEDESLEELAMRKKAWYPIILFFTYGNDVAET